MKKYIISLVALTMTAGITLMSFETVFANQINSQANQSGEFTITSDNGNMMNQATSMMQTRMQQALNISGDDWKSAILHVSTSPTENVSAFIELNGIKYQVNPEKIDEINYNPLVEPFIMLRYQVIF